MDLKSRIWMLPIGAAAVFIVGCIACGVLGSRTSLAVERLRTHDYPSLEALGIVERNVENFRSTLQAVASEGDDSRLKDVEALGATTLSSIDALGKIEGSATLASTLHNAANDYQTVSQAAIRELLAKHSAGDLLTRMQSTMTSLNNQVAANKARAAREVADAQDTISLGVKHGLYAVLGTCLAALVVLGVASKLTIESVWRELGDEPAHLRLAMQRITEGDLSEHALAAVTGRNAHSIAAALGVMVGQLRATVGQIRRATDSISTASGEIATGNQDLSNRTEDTASNLQQAASAMEQLTSTVKQTAQSAMQAQQIANQAASTARDGGEIVSQVVKGMSEINGAAQKIGDIIGVIDGIAFQTNILALNAAVEAARAGEHGRGFAVVAGEVRTLAHRSALAAKEIKALINVSTEKVESGSRLVNDAGRTMQDIVTGVQHVTEVISEISNASAEQSTGIASVNVSVAQLDRMTQQNAALVEESAAAAESLREQAQSLVEAVATFRFEAAQLS